MPRGQENVPSSLLNWRWSAFAVTAGVVFWFSADARAGGFEIPDNGTQAVGRGTAFVSKANDPTAIYHNPAGLARQRGTNLLINGNLFLHSFEFQRIGTFPDDPQDPETPWGNAPYPPVRNIAGPFFAPFVAASTDFGYFDRLTFGIGVFGPPAIGNRTFPLGVEQKPSASRYDFVQSRSTIIFPTLSAGVRVTPWLDLGVSGHLVLANFDQTTVSYADINDTVCKNEEYFRCDSRSTLNASGTSFGATLGAIIRPAPSYAFGLMFRAPVNITATGTVTPEPPKALEGQDLNPGEATLRTQLPFAIRAGGRYIGMDGDFELYDLELNLTYEAWGVSQKNGPIVDIPDLGAFKDVQTVVLHGYNNTFGIRAGGSYNIDTGDGLLSLRGGGYFDSSATDFKYTRLDFDTLTKVAGTLGLGFKIGSFGFDLGYAAVASVPRLVGSGIGEIRPVNGLQKGATVGSDGNLLPPVNEGAYRGFTHIISLGVSVSIDNFFGPPRKIHYGNTYEPNYVGEGADEEEKKDEKKDSGEEKKDDNDEKKDSDKKDSDKDKKDSDKDKKDNGEEKKPEKKPDPDEKPEKKPEKKPDVDPDERPERRPEKKPVVEEPDEKKPEKKPEPPVEKPKPPPPPPPPEKPPTKRKEWWEEL